MSKEGTNLAEAMNEGQKQLLESWENYVHIMRNEFKIDTVFIVGDAVAGVNIKESGLGMLTTDIDEQVDAALNLLEPLCKNKRVGVWSGTHYHEAADFRVHKVIAEALDGTFFSNISNFKLEPTQKVANIAHHTTEAMVYWETALARDMMFYREAVSLNKLYKTNIIIRAHRHRFAELHRYDLHYLTLPAWQVFVPYEKAVRWYFRFIPDIGGAVMLLDDQERIRTMHFLYDTPHIADKLTSG